MVYYIGKVDANSPRVCQYNYKLFYKDMDDTTKCPVCGNNPCTCPPKTDAPAQ